MGDIKDARRRMDKNPSTNFMDRYEKQIIIGFACFAVAVIFLAYFQIFYNLSGPILRERAERNAALKYSQATDLQPTSEDEVLKLKASDTDQDGINDFDELNIYSTSPYLEDSDSDGINDKDEIQKGTDPNCPAGKTCAPAVTQDSGLLTTTPDGEELSAEGESLIGGDATPAQIRKLLLQTKIISQSEINDLSDEEILAIYNETLQTFNQ